MKEFNSADHTLETSRMTSKGQVTVPKRIRQELGLAEGDRVAFVRDTTGKFMIEKVDLITFRKLAGQIAKAFDGITESEAFAELERIREELWNERGKK